MKYAIGLGVLCLSLLGAGASGLPAPSGASLSLCGEGGSTIPLPEDTLLHIENRGVTRIFGDINGHLFKLVTDPAEVEQSANAFLIPAFGSISINIAALMREADNCYAFTLQGPAGTDARFFIANAPLAGQSVAYAIDGLQALPDRLDLLAGYPNPFRERITITYHIPAQRTNGLDVRLAVYDVLGRRVRVLVDEQRFPGRFTVQWDGTGEHGRPVAGGLYFCRLTAGALHETIQVVHVR